MAAAPESDFDPFICGFEEFASSMWRPFVVVARSPRKRGGTVEERLDLLDAEQEVSELLRGLLHLYDAKDLDGIMSLMHPDGQIVNSRGTYVGREACRANWESALEQSTVGFHFGLNPSIRISHDHRQAVIVCDMLAFAGLKHSPDVSVIAATYVLRAVLQDETWLITDLRIAPNITMKVQRSSLQWIGISPEPSQSKTANDWIGADFCLPGLVETGGFTHTS